MPISRSCIALSQKSHTGAAPLNLGLAIGLRIEAPAHVTAALTPHALARFHLIRENCVLTPQMFGMIVPLPMTV
jgi:hypothetical protein